MCTLWWAAAVLCVTAQHTFTACLTGNVLLHWRSLNPGREMSPVGNCPGREMSGRDLSRSGNVQSGNVRSGNVEIGKCQSGNVRSGNVDREMSASRPGQACPCAPFVPKTFHECTAPTPKDQRMCLLSLEVYLTKIRQSYSTVIGCLLPWWMK